MLGELSVSSESELPFFSDLLDSTIKKNGKKLKAKMTSFINAHRRLYLVVLSQSIIDGGLFSVGMVALLATFTTLPMWALYLISFAFGSGVLTAELAAAGVVEIRISGASAEDIDKEQVEGQKDKAQKRKQSLETLHNVLNATATAVPLAVTLIGHYAQPFAPLSSGLTQFFLSHTALGLMGATIAVAGITLGIGLVITVVVGGLQYYLERKAEKYRAEMRAYNRIQKAQRQLESLKELAESKPEYKQDKYFQAAKQGMLFKDELVKAYYNTTARKFDYVQLEEDRKQAKALMSERTSQIQTSEEDKKDKNQAESLMSERTSQVFCGVISLFAGLAIGIGVVAFIGTIGAVTGGLGLIPILIGVGVGLASSGLFYAGYNDTLLRTGRELSVKVRRRYGLSNSSDLVSIPSTNTSLLKKIITNPAVITAFFGVIVLMSAPVLGLVVAVVLGVVAGAIVFGLSYYVKHRNQKLAQLAEKGKVRKHEFLEVELLRRDKAEKIEAEAKASVLGQEVSPNKGIIAVPVGASFSHRDLRYSPGPTPRALSPISSQDENDSGSMVAELQRLLYLPEGKYYSQELVKRAKDLLLKLCEQLPESAMGDPIVMKLVRQQEVEKGAHLVPLISTELQAEYERLRKDFLTHVKSIDRGIAKPEIKEVDGSQLQNTQKTAEIEDGFELFEKVLGSKVERTPEVVLRLLDEKSKKDNFSLSGYEAKETVRKGLCGLARFVGDKITALENALEKEGVDAVQPSAVQKEMSKWMEVIARFKDNPWPGVYYMAVLRNAIFDSELKFDPKILAAVIKEDKSGVFTDIFLTRYLPSYKLAPDETNLIRKALYENLEEAVKSCNKFARQNLVVAFKKHFPNPREKSLDKLTYARNWINRFSMGCSEVKPFPPYQRGVITQQANRSPSLPTLQQQQGGELKKFSDNLFIGAEEKRLLLLGSRPLLSLVGIDECKELEGLQRRTPPAQLSVDDTSSRNRRLFALDAINNVLKAKSGNSSDITLWNIIYGGLHKKLMQDGDESVGELKIAIQSTQEVSELFDASGQVRQIGGLPFLTSQKEIDAYLQQISPYLSKLGIIKSDAIKVTLLDRAPFYDHGLIDARTGEVIKFREYKEYIDTLVKEYESNDLTYAHCYSGKERSPQVVGALMISENIRACTLLMDSYPVSNAVVLTEDKPTDKDKNVAFSSASSAVISTDEPTDEDKIKALSGFFQTPCEIFESINGAREEAKKFSSMMPQQQRIIFKLFFKGIYNLDEKHRKSMITAFANKSPSVIAQNLDMYFRTLASDGRDIGTVVISKESTAYKIIKLLFEELKKNAEAQYGSLLRAHVIKYIFKDDMLKLLINNGLIPPEDPINRSNRLVKVLRSMSFFSDGDKPVISAYQPLADFMWENKEALKILCSRSKEVKVSEGAPQGDPAPEDLEPLLDQKGIVDSIVDLLAKIGLVKLFESAEASEKPNLQAKEVFEQKFSLWCESNLKDAKELNELLDSEAGQSFKLGLQTPQTLVKEPGMGDGDPEESRRLIIDHL